MTQAACAYDRPVGVLDEDVLLAVLHFVSGHFTEEQVIRAMDEAAAAYGGMFSVFQKHPNGGCRQVSDMLLMFAIGGSVRRPNLKEEWLESTPHTQGLWGQLKARQFNRDCQAAFGEIALRIMDLALGS